MRAQILCLSLMLYAVTGAQGALIWHYRMDSFALLSDAVVLCEEEAVRRETVSHPEWKEEKTMVRCRVACSFKGGLVPDAWIEAEYGSLYCRWLPGDEGYTLMDRHNKVLRVVEPKYLPPGRALLFLKKVADKDSYTIVTAKLILTDGAVYQFGQFYRNPGGLELAPQKPENIRLGPGQSYGEAELVADLLAALEKAANLKAPVPMIARDALR